MSRKSFFKVIFMAFLITLLCSMTALAAPAIKRVQYESNGKVEVEFTTKVKYKNVKVKVTDSKGKKVKACVVSKEGEELEFRLGCCKPGKTYKFTICGVRKKGEKKYGKVKGSIWIPKTKRSVPVKEIEYDKQNLEVEFEFSRRVEWKNPVVKITSGDENYVVRIKEKDSDSVEAVVKELTPGKIYQYRISGIRKKGASKYTTISGSFMA